MARKSKYFSNENVVNKKIWSVALYIRLSQEDSDNGTEKQESNSVTSQKTLLNEFTDTHDDLIVYDTYIDDGFTGTDFNRPSFQRLLEDMRNGNINCVIVKDLSRLGRNYIEVGNYIEQVFPLFNIRFIAINDSVDSFKNQEIGVGIPIGNQTSQWFGLYYLDEIDRLIKEKLRILYKC